jgi:hypothetical protein
MIGEGSGTKEVNNPLCMAALPLTTQAPVATSAWSKNI